MFLPNVTILILWSSKGIYFYNYGVDKMVKLWNSYLTSKYQNDPTWPFRANIELVDYKSNVTYVNHFLNNRLITNIPSKVSIIIAPEGQVGYNNAYLASKFNIPYIMPTTNPDPVYYKLDPQFNTSFFIKSPAFYTFRAIIDQYIKVGVKTIATVSYIDDFDKNYNYWSCYGAAMYLAVPRGIKYVASFNLYSNSTKSDVINIALQLQNINPDALLWCDWQSCSFTDKNSANRLALKALNEIGYLPNTINVLDCFNTIATEKYIDEGLFDYVTESTYSHPNLKGFEYVENQNPYSNIFRSSNNILTVVDEINIGYNINTLSSVKIFYNWYKNVTGHAPTYKSNGFWAVLELIESAIYRAAINTKNNKMIDSQDITSLLINSQVTGTYGVVSFDANHINSITSTIAVQFYPGNSEPYIISPSTQFEKKYIYPIPNWEERVYVWSLYKNSEVINGIIFASICSFLLITLMVTITIHRNESDIRMLRYSHMMAICLSSMVAIWSLVFLWQDDMNLTQCNSYLWGVYLPTSFVIQMVNLKAYRLSIFLNTKDTERLHKLTHFRMFILSLGWTTLTIFYLIIVSTVDPPTLVKIIKDPYRPVYDKHYCMVGNTSTILTYLLASKHILFSIGCVLNIRNGTGEFRDGVVMKESFVILWSCIVVTYILHFLGIGTNRTYILRTGFMSIGLTMFCFRLLFSRCYRHWFPDYVDNIFKNISNNVKKLLSFSYKKYEMRVFSGSPQEIIEVSNRRIIGITNEVQESEMNSSGHRSVTSQQLTKDETSHIATISLSNIIGNTNKTIKRITTRSMRFSLDTPLYAKVEPTKFVLDEMYNVINNENEMHKFRDIVEKALLVENLDFILSINNYRNKSKQYFMEFSKQINNNMKKDAYECYKKFIETNSEFEVNISSSVRTRIMNQLETWIDNHEFFPIETIQSILNDDRYHHINIFEKAYNEISIMLYQNIWNKYIAEQIKNSMC